MQTANNAPDFHTTNPHSEHFNEFGNARLFERLQKKFKPKPYHYQYRIIRAVVLGSSFLFHILSAATAAALIWIFISKLISSELFNCLFCAEKRTGCTDCCQADDSAG